VKNFETHTLGFPEDPDFLEKLYYVMERFCDKRFNPELPI